jgi:hypothetical protein
MSGLDWRLTALVRLVRLDFIGAFGLLLEVVTNMLIKINGNL